MQLKPSEIHVWATQLTLTDTEENEKYLQLSTDERERANRYHFPRDRQRFIAARAMLREILGLYTNLPPTAITFCYDDHEKPHLTPHSPLKFNLSHSDDIAVYAFTLNHAIGIDIEKVQASYNEAVAERFFSQHENNALLSMPIHDRVTAFYRIWARKEAIIKAIGKGLTLPLSSFSVRAEACHEVIQLNPSESWSLMPIMIHPDYQSALATNQSTTHISQWTLTNQSPKLIKGTHL